MFTVKDLRLFSDIFIKELSAVNNAYIQHCSTSLCRHYLEDSLLYPVCGKQNILYRSAIPMHAKRHGQIKDFLFEVIEVGDETDSGYMTFHEYLYHTWLFFEKAVYKNLKYCLDNYALTPEQRGRFSAICDLNEEHFFCQQIRKVSLDLFAKTLISVSSMDFEQTMESVYGVYDNNQLGLRTVLRYRRLPPSYQAFLLTVFEKPPSFISFRTPNSDTILTWSLGDDVYVYVKDCLRHLKRVQREHGTVVITDRSSLHMGLELPIRVYKSDVYRARVTSLTLASKQTEVYKSRLLPSGAVKSSLIKKA